MRAVRAAFLLALCGVAVAPTWAPLGPAVQDLRSRDTVALNAGGWTLELEVRGYNAEYCALSSLRPEHMRRPHCKCMCVQRNNKMRTTCAQCELARDPADYDAGDESIDISITLSHYPSVKINSTSPASSRPPVPPGTALQGQILIDGAAPAGSFTFEALDVDPNSHVPGTMMSFLNLGPVPLVLVSHRIFLLCTLCAHSAKICAQASRRQREEVREAREGVSKRWRWARGREGDEEEGTDTDGAKYAQCECTLDRAQ